MDKVITELKLLREEQLQLKKLKQIESQQQQQFIQNCKQVLSIYKQKKSDFALDNLIQFNETISSISNDVLGFKSIRQRLFMQASQEKTTTSKLYLFLFHLFESLVCNISTLVSKGSQQLIQQVPEDLLSKIKNNNDLSMCSLNQEEGFFSDNYKAMLKNQQQIDEVVDFINKDSKRQSKLYLKERNTLDKFLKELQLQQQNQTIDNSFEVRWSLQELENIVYEFVNAKMLPHEFDTKLNTPLEANLDEIMKIQKNDEKEEVLPNFVRDLILHDRGNSLFLSDSFANLPSPVNESQQLRKLFKPKENEEDFKNKRKDKNDKEDNIKIKIEGKEADDFMDQKPMANIDVKEIERIVFNSKDKSKQNFNNQPPITKYQEEDSYINPQKADYQSEDDYDNQNVESFNQTAVKESKLLQYQETSICCSSASEVEHNTIILNCYDINIESNKNSYQPQRKELVRNPYLPNNQNFINKNLCINILDEQSSMVSNSESNRSLVMKSDLNQFQSIDSSDLSKQNLINKYLIHQKMSGDSLVRHSNNQEGQIQLASSINSSEQSQDMPHQKNRNFQVIEYKQNTSLDISEDGEHSSCKDTVKIHEQKDFSFFKEASEIIKQSLPVDWKQQLQSNSLNNNLQSDTVTRLQGLNNSKLSDNQTGPSKGGIKHNPFRIDTHTISQEVVDQFAYKNHINSSNEFAYRKGLNNINQSSKRSISPIESHSRNSNNLQQQNIGRCVSLKNLEGQKNQKIPYHSQNIQPLTNKNSVSTYDPSMMEGDNNGIYTPSMGAHNEFLSQRTSIPFSQVPSKKSISTSKYKLRKDQVGKQKKSSYLKGIEGKVDPPSNLKNLDALKMILSRNSTEEGRNYISLPSNYLGKSTQKSMRQSMKEGDKPYEINNYQSVTERANSQRDSSTANRSASGLGKIVNNQNQYSSIEKESGQKLQKGFKKNKVRRGPSRERPRQINEGINLSALPEIQKKFGYQL